MLHVCSLLFALIIFVICNMRSSDFALMLNVTSQPAATVTLAYSMNARTWFINNPENRAFKGGNIDHIRKRKMQHVT